MPSDRTDETVSRAHLRHWAWFVALVLALVSWRIDGAAKSWILKAAASALFVLGTLWPFALSTPYRLFMVITYPARRSVDLVLLAAVYYGVLTPVAWCVRFWRADGLQCRFDPSLASYWQPRAKGADRGSYYRQF
jgi:hypothetical protein